MIFYRAVEPGTLHTKIRGTQADAKAVNRDFAQIDIPTDKAGLMAYVQDLHDQIDNLRDQLHATEGTLTATVPLPEMIEKLEELPRPAPIFTPENIDDNSVFNPRLLEEQVEALGTAGETALDQLESYQQLTGVGHAFARGVCLLNVIAAGEHQLVRVFQRRKKKFG